MALLRPSSRLPEADARIMVGTKKFDLLLPTDLHKALRMAAVERDTTMKDLVVQGLAAIGIAVSE
jgi:hypothetical protein